MDFLRLGSLGAKEIFDIMNFVFSCIVWNFEKCRYNIAAPRTKCTAQWYKKLHLKPAFFHSNSSLAYYYQLRDISKQCEHNCAYQLPCSSPNIKCNIELILLVKFFIEIVDFSSIYHKIINSIYKNTQLKGISIALVTVNETLV